MPLSPKITFRSMPRSEALDRSIARCLDSFGRLGDRIVSCRVAVEARPGNHHDGKFFHVRIGLVVPGGGIIVGRDPAMRHPHEDVHVALRDAFHAARRRLEDLERRHGGDVARGGGDSGDGGPRADSIRPAGPHAVSG